MDYKRGIDDRCRGRDKDRLAEQKGLREFSKLFFFGWFYVSRSRAPGTVLLNELLPFHCILSAQRRMTLNKHQSSPHFMLPNGERQAATPQRAITNSNEKGEGGISPLQPCLICRLLGNWDIPPLYFCLKVLQGSERMPYSRLGRRVKGPGETK